MRIDLVSLRLRMSSKMELDHSIDRNGVDMTRPIEATIETGNEDVVDVEQQPAIGAYHDLADERPIRPFRIQ